MFKKVAKENIYSEHGALLLSKGSIITDEIQRKLSRLNTFELPERRPLKDISKNAPSNESQRIFDNAANRMQQKSLNLDPERFNRSSLILKKIIFDAKLNQWWMLTQALFNYLDWLYTHSIDVALMSLLIASQKRYSDKELKEIALGAFLHDIGMLLIPKTILTKTTTLEDSEKQLIKQHCDLGYSVIQEYNLSNISVNIILQHHERLDGTGFPRGISEAYISPEAQIVALADVIDANTSYYPRHTIKDINTVLQELNKKGLRFDAENIHIFKSLMNS
ncbi:HD domain-containing protein [Aminipila butyrica]|uniref:HD domain-containing protein n=1 Tax=Aminipila butyrica TaxID=433296 RepID=A0A858BQR8_9FIRM|nr:HD domain-containing phosphohydrolase [Aminipila butyrica]QIB67867.1 HD domain-containing protein [Aminipila butyrica]